MASRSQTNAPPVVPKANPPSAPVKPEPSAAAEKKQALREKAPRKKARRLVDPNKVPGRKAKSDASQAPARRWRRGQRGETLQRSPAYAIAGFLHMVFLVLLSFWTIATHFSEERLPVDVSLIPQKKVVPVTAGMDQEKAALDALMDSTANDLEGTSEADTDDPFHEALGDASGEVNVFGAGGGGRSGMGRGGSNNNRGGASRASEGSLKGGLDWLFRHRTRDGAWVALARDHKNARDIPKLKGGELARTAMALLCFLCADHGAESEGPYQGVVRDAQDWLVKRVEEGGRFRPTGRQQYYHCYQQAICTLALAESLGRYRAANSKPPAQLEKAVRRAVRFLERRRTRYGWRYYQGDADTSVTSWVVLALKSAESAGVAVSPQNYDVVRDWLDEVSAPAGTTGYTSRRNPNAAMNATGLFLRIMLGEAPTTPMNRAAARLVSKHQIQVQDNAVGNFYATYYAALAMYQVGGRQWKEFNPRIRDSLIAVQKRGKSCERGSWRGTRYVNEPVLATCFATLSLETYYRYLPQHEGLDAEPDPEPEEQLSAGERLLDLATLAMNDARTDGGGAVLHAEAAYTRALSKLVAERASWKLRQEARARLVEIATIAKDKEQIVARVDEYLRGMPEGKQPDPDVLRVRRLQQFRLAMQSARDAYAADASEAQKGEGQQRLKEIEALLVEEIPKLEPATESRNEAEHMLGRVQDAYARLVFAVDPDQAIEETLAEVSKTPAEGPVGPQERQLLVALLLRANGRFEATMAKKTAHDLEVGTKDLEAFSARKPRFRFTKADYARLEGLLQRGYLARSGALLALGRYLAAKGAVEAFRRRFPGSPLLSQAESVERAALAQRAKQGKATPEESARLTELLRRYATQNPELSASESLGMGDLLLSVGNLDGARQQYFNVINRDAKPEVQTLARLGLAKLARKSGDAERAAGHIQAIQGPERDRLDVILEQCQVLRDKEQPRAALEEYLMLLRALETDEPKAWWDVAEQTAYTYVECGEVAAARTFLEDLRVKDGGKFGGDPVQRERFIEFMRRVDVMR